jgi:mono/diheme cytochrome c family protein
MPLGGALVRAKKINSLWSFPREEQEDCMKDEPGVWRVILAGLMVGGALWFSRGTSLAQEQEVSAAGKNVFAQHCVVCHGREAKGDGVAASLLTVKPADLTQIAKRAGGTFPFWKVYGIIDGREDVKGHGTRDMPIWGAEFRAQTGGSPTAESQTRGRILELVYYIQSIQAK